MKEKKRHVRNIKLNIDAFVQARSNVLNHDGKVDVVTFSHVWIMEGRWNIVRKTEIGLLFWLLEVRSKVGKEG